MTKEGKLRGLRATKSNINEDQDNLTIITNYNNYYAVGKWERKWGKNSRGKDKAGHGKTRELAKMTCLDFAVAHAQCHLLKVREKFGAIHGDEDS